MKKTLLIMSTLVVALNLSATVYTFDVRPTVTKTASPYAVGDVFLSGSDICLNATTSTNDDVWYPIFANPSSNGLSYSYKDNETNISSGKKAIVYKASENAFVFDGSNRKMKISGLTVGDRIYMSIGSKGSTPHTFSVTGATADASNPALSAKGENYSYSNWYYTATATDVIFVVSAGGSIIQTIKTGADVTSSVNPVLADKGISYNGNEIVNRDKIAIEIYDVLGKRVAASNNNISVTNYDKGVYFVRVAGSKETLKFNK